MNKVDSSMANYPSIAKDIDACINVLKQISPLRKKILRKKLLYLAVRETSITCDLVKINNYKPKFKDVLKALQTPPKNKESIKVFSEITGLNYENKGDFSTKSEDLAMKLIESRGRVSVINKAHFGFVKLRRSFAI